MKTKDDYDYAANFVDHIIVDRMVTEKFGTWLLKKPGCGSFWCRITAADGQLSVIGDFNPTVFAYYSDHRDPISCVAWIGKTAEDDTYYPIQKACIGTGRHAVMQETVEAARKALKWRLDEELAERANEFGPGWTPEDGPDGAYARVLQAGLDEVVEFDGAYGVHEIVSAMYAENDEAGEFLREMGNFAEEIRDDTRLGCSAVRRLWALLSAELELARAREKAVSECGI